MNKKSVKCVVWDLDNTLWSGILSEGDEIALNDGVLELILALDSMGVLQSVASKNNEADAIKKLEELGVSQYFLYPQINWNAKSNSIITIQTKLNIGLDTFLFIDDQPFELDEVKAVCSEVECVNALECSDLLLHPRISSIKTTDDSKYRRQRYQEDEMRDKDMSDFKGPPDSFLATLNMHFKITQAEEEDLVRAEELTERTNQLNSTGITFSRDELASFMVSQNHDLLVCELEDKYGSYGKIGLALVERGECVDTIKLLLMSCRTASRGAGSVLINYLMRRTKQQGKRLQANFKRTDRNRQMLITYQFSNFVEIERDEAGNILFENNLEVIPDVPSYLTLTTFKEEFDVIC
ncbi:HAD-IIIC family phosphatase [Saccharophagus degradans]|uniref:HAD-IIIC family phosphatase n=1 Tax=Saccharophagus degradans TaxID=86304 RepID=UPI001C082263|nr:HAD-IIIC family phosphatase [Saccharophagus degradans]